MYAVRTRFNCFVGLETSPTGTRNPYYPRDTKASLQHRLSWSWAQDPSLQVLPYASFHVPAYTMEQQTLHVPRAFCVELDSNEVKGRPCCRCWGWSASLVLPQPGSETVSFPHTSLLPRPMPSSPFSESQRGCGRAVITSKSYLWKPESGTNRPLKLAFPFSWPRSQHIWSEKTCCG